MGESTRLRKGSDFDLVEDDLSSREPGHKGCSQDFLLVIQVFCSNFMYPDFLVLL